NDAFESLAAGDTRAFLIEVAGLEEGVFRGDLVVLADQREARGSFEGRVVSCPEVQVPLALGFGDEGEVRTRTATLSSRSSQAFSYTVREDDEPTGFDLDRTAGTLEPGAVDHFLISTVLDREPKQTAIKVEFPEESLCDFRG